MAQEVSDCAVVKRVSGGGGDLSVGGDLTFRDGANDAAEGLIAKFAGAQAFAEESALKFVGRKL